MKTYKIAVVPGDGIGKEVVPEGAEYNTFATPWPFPMNSRKNAALNLGSVLPKLKSKWEAWRLSRAHTS